MRWPLTDDFGERAEMTRRAGAEQPAGPARAACLRSWARIALPLVLLWDAGHASGPQAQEAALVQKAAPAPAIDPAQLQELVTTLEDPAARNGSSRSSRR